MKNLLHEVAGKMRAASQLGIVTSVNDASGAQTVNLSTGDGVDRADVEVAWPFGFSSVPPTDGPVSLVIEIGGDPGNLIALPVGNPSARFGGLLAGEAVIYGGDGSRVHIRQGGQVEIWGMNVVVHAATLVIEASTSVTVATPEMTVSGNLTAGGDVADSHGTLDRLRQHYNAHSHASLGAPPTPQDPE